MPSMTKDDLPKLEIIETEGKRRFCIDGKPMNFVSDYELKKDKDFPGAALLKLELLVRFP